MKKIIFISIASLILIVVVLSSCTNSENREQQMLGKWKLIQMNFSTDGGQTYENVPINSYNELILLRDGLALYTNQVTYHGLDSAAWRVYANGDSIEILDEKRKFTGMYNQYRISQLFTEKTFEGENCLFMDLEEAETHNDPVEGVKSVILKKRYQQILPAKIVVTDTEAPLLNGSCKIYSKFVASHKRTNLYKSAELDNRPSWVDSLIARPVKEEQAQAYSIIWQYRDILWVKRDDVTEVNTIEVTPETVDNSFIAPGTNFTGRRFKEGNLEGLSVYFYYNRYGKGRIVVGLLRNGIIILPEKFDMEAILTEEDGFSVEPGWTSNVPPRVYWGPDYLLKSENLSEYLDMEKLSKEQIMAIWRAAQDTNPNRVWVYYRTNDIVGYHIVEEDVE